MERFRYSNISGIPGNNCEEAPRCDAFLSPRVPPALIATSGQPSSCSLRQCADMSLASAGTAAHYPAARAPEWAAVCIFPLATRVMQPRRRSRCSEKKPTLHMALCPSCSTKQTPLSPACDRCAELCKGSERLNQARSDLPKQ